MAWLTPLAPTSVVVVTIYVPLQMESWASPILVTPPEAVGTAPSPVAIESVIDVRLDTPPTMSTREVTITGFIVAVTNGTSRPPSLVRCSGTSMIDASAVSRPLLVVIRVLMGIGDALTVLRRGFLGYRSTVFPLRIPLVIPEIVATVLTMRLCRSPANEAFPTARVDTASSLLTAISIGFPILTVLRDTCVIVHTMKTITVRRFPVTMAPSIGEFQTIADGR